jgi:hypothetical protein
MLTDLDDTLIAWLEPALDAVFGTDTIDIKPASVVSNPQATVPAVHLMAGNVIEHPSLKGTGETTRIDGNNQSFVKPPPAWLQFTYQLAAEIPSAAVGQAPFVNENLRQSQLRLLEPLAKQLLKGEEIDSNLLQGCFAGTDADCTITNVLFKRIFQHDVIDVPVIEFALTASVAVRDEFALNGPVTERTFDANPM